jgi:hypothetical protein
MKTMGVVCFVCFLALGGAVSGWAADEVEPTKQIRLTVRGQTGTDPAQAEAARAAARQAERDAVEVEAKTAEQEKDKQAQRLNQESLQQHDAPLRNFGVLSGPLSPTVPTGIRR